MALSSTEKVSLAKVFLLRGVVALCLFSSWLFVGMVFEWKQFGYPWRSRLWIGLTSLFTLVHHFLMSFYVNTRFEIADVPILLPEIAGLVFFILGVIDVDRFKLTTDPGSLLSPSSNVCIAVCCIVIVFLFLEILSRFLSLITWHSLSGSHEPREFKPYQILFGRAASTENFKGEVPEAMQHYFSEEVGKRELFARKCLLRVVIACSCASLALVAFALPLLGSSDPIWITLLPSIIFHHLLSCMNTQFSYVLADLPFLILEIASAAPWIRNVGQFNQWSSEPLVSYSFFAWVIFACLLVEAAIRIGSLVYLAWLITWSKGSPTKNIIGPKIPTPQNVLFGYTLWKSHLTGETYIIRVSRGLMAMAFILIIFFSSVLDVVLYPVQEIGLTPASDIRALDTPPSLQPDPVVWRVVFTSSYYGTDTAPGPSDWDSIFQAAVNVTPLWDNSGVQNSPCVHVPEDTLTVPLVLPFTSALKVNSVYCPPRVPIPPDPVFFTLTAQDSTPDLLILVNFTALGIATDTVVNLFNSSVQVMIGLVNDTQTVIDRTVATTLFPGMNVIGSVTWDVRQTLNNPRLSTFGFLSSYDTFLVSRMINVLPDPLASRSPLIPSSLDISTFRISLQTDISELRVLQDYRSKSVLSGLAEVGGLWTFLSGVFAVIFGSTLLRIMFGSKSISFVGHVHSLRREEIRKACLEEYPKITEQISRQGDQRDLLSFLCDQLLDVQFLQADEVGKGSEIETKNAKDLTPEATRLLDDESRL